MFKNRYHKIKTLCLTLTALSCLESFALLADESIDSELQKRCESTFKIIENRNYQAFINLMPFTPTDEEIEHSKAYLDKKHEEWFVKSGGILEVKRGKVQHQQPDDEIKEKYGAIQKTKTKIRVLAKNFNTSTYCVFIQTPNGWFLSRLP